MSFGTEILPAGTTQKQLISIPRSDWSGLTRIRMATSVDATVHSWEFINDAENDGKTRFRRVGYTSTGNNLYNIPLKKNEELGWWAGRLESMVKIVYTATNPVTFIFETIKGIEPSQLATVPVTQWNKQAAATPWTSNTTPNNPTEYHIFDGVRDALGLTYWVPRT